MLGRVRSLLVWTLAVAMLAVAVWASGYYGAIVGSGSMSPALQVGDVVVVRRGARARAGDIVVYDKPGWRRAVVHRAVAELPDGRLVTRGDANPVRDRDPVTRESVQGTVVAVLPLGRVVALAAERR